MLERYFVRPDTVDRVRESWVGGAIERYVADLSERGYSWRSVYRRIPVLMAFGEFAWGEGARSWPELPAFVEGFVRTRLSSGRAERSADAARREGNFFRQVTEGMIEVVVPGWKRASPRSDARVPLAGLAPGFFAYLRDERGLRAASVRLYTQHLRRFEDYLGRVDCGGLEALSPPLLSGFVTEVAAQGYAASSMTGLAGALRVFLRYAHSRGLISRDLSGVVEAPQRRALANVPRFITWDEVRLMLEAVDVRTGLGRRDYAILLLLVTYGLRAREVAALTLDDVDWERDRLLVPGRKNDHTTAYPLAPVVGEAIVAYLKDGRPEGHGRNLFFTQLAPVRPMTHTAVSLRAQRYLGLAGINVVRAGSHTLRHTCAQRLLEAGFPLKTIGDYVGHASSSSTQIYTKVQLEALREVALGDIEELS